MNANQITKTESPNTNATGLFVHHLFKNLVIALLSLALVITAVKLNLYNGCLDSAWDLFKQLALCAADQFERLIDSIRPHAHSWRA